MKTVLITGGAGFIGSNLTKRLLDDGDFVVAFDNLSTGLKNNIIDFETNKNYRFIEGDILNKSDLSILDGYNFDIIKINTIGVFNLADIAMKNNSIFVQSSTSEVYGDPKQNPQSENYWGNVNPCGVRACYDEGKRCAEAFLFDCKRYYDLDVRIIRIFNTYGPNMAPFDGRCIVSFFANAIKNKDIEIYGTGKQSRSFCYIDDLIGGIIQLVNLSEPPETPINLGNNYEITILELAEKIISCCNSQSKIVFMDGTQDDPHVRQPDISLAKETLGWSPSISLESGLLKCKKYFEEVIK